MSPGASVHRLAGVCIQLAQLFLARHHLGTEQQREEIVWLPVSVRSVDGLGQLFRLDSHAVCAV